MHILHLDTPKVGKLIGYARVSLDDQNLDLQFDALTRAGVERQNIYADYASGAPNVRRAAYDNLWRDLRQDDILVAWKLDRLGRSVMELLSVLERVQQVRARLIVLTEMLDTSTPQGMFAFHIMAALAEMERGLIRERTMAGLAAAIARGKRPGRPPVLVGEKEDRAVDLLRAGRSVPEVAQAIGVSESTLYEAVRGRLAQRILVDEKE